MVVVGVDGPANTRRSPFLQEQTDAAQLSVVLDLFCLKREGCDGTLR